MASFNPGEWAEEEAKPTKRELNSRMAAEALALRQAFLDGDKAAHEAELIRDILRVADDPENRYPGTEEVVFDLFGNHAEFQRCAGLRDNRTTTAYRNRRAKLKTEERITDYLRREVMPWAGAFDRSLGVEHLRLLVGSDFHGQEVDKQALAVFIDVAKRVQPDIIALNGDVLDFKEAGRWSKNPSRLLDLQAEIDWTVENIFQPLREACPEAQIDLFIGNHEYRLIRYLADTAPGLASLRCLSFPELLKLGQLRIGLVHNDSLLNSSPSPYKQDWKEYGGCFIVTHGHFAGQSPAKKELARHGSSGTSGHVHTPEYAANPTGINPHADWMITPMMACMQHGKDFIQGPSRWLTGFGYVDIFPRRGVALPQLVVKKAGIMSFCGTIYSDE